MIRKLKSRKGESIAEVLVATLIAALATVMFASMVTASENMVRKSEKAYGDYTDDRNKIADQWKQKRGSSASVMIDSKDNSVRIKPGTGEPVILYQDPEKKHFMYGPVN